MTPAAHSSRPSSIPIHLVREEAHSSVHLFEQGAPWQAGRLRYHHGYELHLMVSAHRGAYIGGEVHRFSPGCVVLIGPGVPHNLAYLNGAAEGEKGEHRSLSLQFTDAPLRKGMELFPELRMAESLLDRARQGVAFTGMGELIGARFQKVKELHGLARFAEFAALLHDLTQSTSYRTLSRIPAAPSEVMAGRHAAQIYQALDYIQKNYTSQLTLSDVSAVCKMTVSAFSRRFHHTTCSTFTDFVVSLRVAEACRQLLHTRKDVSSICYEAGFNNISNFNRHFRKLKGMTPRQYRVCSGFGEGLQNAICDHG